MGLAERRAIKAFQETTYPELEKQIHAAAGMPIPVEVDWNTLAFEGYADSYAESLPNIFFVPLIKGLEKVAVDDMGKDAVRDGITKIVIKGSDNYSSWWAELEHKVLTLTYSFCNVADVDDRVDVLVQKLEARV